MQEGRLRQMDVETQQNLRDLEATGAEAENIRDIVYGFMLPTIGGDVFRGVSGRPSKTQKFMDVGASCIYKYKARNT